MTRTSRLVVGLLAAVVVATAGCTLPVLAPKVSDPSAPDTTAGHAPAVPGTRASWRPCPEVPKQLVGRAAAGMTYECASVAVPRDWAAPKSGQTYDVAMIRIRSRTQQNRIGSLVLNPGGPGGSGIDTAVYLSAVTHDLDFAVKLGRLEQLEEKARDGGDLARRYPAERSQLAADGRRIALHVEDAIDERARRLAGHEHHKPGKGAHRHAGIWILMGGSESASDETNGFRAKAAAITNIFEEAPHSGSHKHAHTEAMLYVLEGRGYSMIDGERIDWEAGDAVHVPPRMTVHEHLNDSAARTRTLRIEFGIRFFYESLWKGYQKVQDKLEASAR